ncbi:MAG: hypothetical protein LBQ02_02030, partial [Candidatus Nomurabacteria bacterium]|nr:hypothetical protein [Candidatus Nomurabacteria bacterium]
MSAKLNNQRTGNDAPKNHFTQSKTFRVFTVVMAILATGLVVSYWTKLQSLADPSYSDLQSQGINIAVAAGEGINVDIDATTCNLNLLPSPSGFLSNCQITATITTNNSNG